jgi:hypothetical protein
MLIVRESFTAKPGQAGKLAKLFKRMFANDANTTVMTDLIGCYNSVVMERRMESLASFEEEFNQYKSGKMPDMDPALMEEMKGYTELWLKGKREIFQIID